MRGHRSLPVIAVCLAVLGAAVPAAAQPAATPDAALRVDFEYLLWWLKDSPAPAPLVSTGLIGAPGTTVQVDRAINPTQNASFGGAPPTTLAGPASPSFRFRGSDFWSQGLSVGVDVRF